MTRRTRIAAALLHLSVWELPAPHRDRYRRELLAELHELPVGQRLGYSLRVLARAWSLRAALEGSPAAIVEGDTVTKRLRCRLHRHAWRTQHNEQGQAYQICVYCPAERDPFDLNAAGSDYGSSIGGGSTW
jgi:hypothetical protein